MTGIIRSVGLGMAMMKDTDTERSVGDHGPGTEGGLEGERSQPPGREGGLEGESGQPPGREGGLEGERGQSLEKGVTKGTRNTDTDRAVTLN